MRCEASGIDVQRRGRADPVIVLHTRTLGGYQGSAPAWARGWLAVASSGVAAYRVSGPGWVAWNAARVEREGGMTPTCTWPPA